MTGPSFRRFWTNAAIIPHAEGWAVALDGKIALTPMRAPLATEHQQLARAAAAEWSDAPETIDPRAMPMTGFLNAVIDRVRPNAESLAAEVARFAMHEAICYRAEGPPELVRRQGTGWDPILDWIRRRYDAALKTGSGVMPVTQTADALARLEAEVRGLDPYRLAAALKLSGIYKSLALTLAAIEAERTADSLYEASRIEESFQAEQWGEDAEASRRVAHERSDVAIAARFLALLG